MNAKIDYAAKIVLLGNSATGKTTLLRAFEKKQLSNRQEPQTIGIDLVRIFQKIDNKKIQLCIWDTAGQERYRNVTKTYLSNVDAIIYVYSVVDQTSLTDLQYWIKQSSQYGRQSLLHIFVGNKSDLTEDLELSSNKISRESAMETISGYFEKYYSGNSQLRAPFVKQTDKNTNTVRNNQHKQMIQLFEVSAKTKNNIQQLFNHLLRQVFYKKMMENPIGRRPICLSDTESLHSFSPQKSKKNSECFCS